MISSGGTALAAESSERYDAADLSKPYRTEEFSAEETYEQDSYREGEAIAIVRGLEKPQVAGDIERLAEVSPDSLQAVTEEWQAPGNEMEVKQGRMQGMDTFTVWGITDHDKTAAQIIGELYAEPNVIAAEPNYLSYADQENEPAEQESNPQESSSDEAASAQTADAARADLSFMQWYAGDLNSEDSKAKNYTTPLSPTSSYRSSCPPAQPVFVNSGMNCS